MSKSTGNFLTLQTLIDKGYDALDYRLFLLGAHYRTQIAFSWDAMDSARNSRKALVQRVANILKDASFSGTAEDAENTANAKKDWSAPAAEYLDKFKAAMENDLSTPKALSVLRRWRSSSMMP